MYYRKYQIVSLHSWEHRLAGVLSLTVKHTQDEHHHSRVGVDLDGARTRIDTLSFNYKTNESIWEKPKCLAELDG